MDPYTLAMLMNESAGATAGTAGLAGAAGGSKFLPAIAAAGAAVAPWAMPAMIGLEGYNLFSGNRQKKKAKEDAKKKEEQDEITNAAEALAAWLASIKAQRAKNMMGIAARNAMMSGTRLA